MSHKDIKAVAEQLTIEAGYEYQSMKYRGAMAYWLRRIRRELRLERRSA